MSTLEGGNVHFPVKNAFFFTDSEFRNKRNAEAAEKDLLGRSLLGILGVEQMLHNLNQEYLQNRGEVVWTPLVHNEFVIEPTQELAALSAVSLQWRPEERLSVFPSPKAYRLAAGILNARRLGWFLLENEDESYPSDSKVANYLEDLPDDDDQIAPYINTVSSSHYKYVVPLISNKTIMAMSPAIPELAEKIQIELTDTLKFLKAGRIL